MCYIPPENSNVYKNVKSPLYEFDFFEQLCEDVRKYSDFGKVYITGDLNARTGEELDVVPNVNHDRYVDSPINENDTSNLPQRVMYTSTIKSPSAVLDIKIYKTDTISR